MELIHQELLPSKVAIEKITGKLKFGLYQRIIKLLNLRQTIFQRKSKVNPDKIAL